PNPGRILTLEESKMSFALLNVSPTFLNVIEIIMLVLIVVAAAVLTIAVLLQKSKGQGMSSAISGTSSETYYGKGKGGSREKKLNKLTMVLAIFFAVVVLAFCIIQPFKARLDLGNTEDLITATAADTTTAAPETTKAPTATTAPTTTAAPAQGETPTTTA
ncbi:MAG: preprotein translocase subunit SecG, partial [Clostridia bacterium]|nr:preprotein translocase subunit SecG [Clostridia bacterium]